MNLFKKFLCVLIAVAMVSSIVGCDDKDATSSKDDASSVPVSSEEITSSEALEETSSAHREAYVPEKEEPAFVDTDGMFDYKTVKWAGPDGYVIVVPKGNSAALESAEALQGFFEKKMGVKPNIVDDSTAVAAKEILIGKTNRSQSSKKLAEKELEVTVKDGKLVFSGGHNVTVDSAVQKFIRLSPKKGNACTFKVTTDFTSKMFNNYSYVWGDEFEGDGLDLTKWIFDKHAMSGTATVETSCARDIVDAQDGRLKMHTRRIFNPQKEGSEYRVTDCVASSDTMNWLYGYLEIRARVPFTKGAWPGFWACSASNVSGIKHDKVVAEVDMFEVFGSVDSLVSNLHKHTKGVGSVQINSIEEWNKKSTYKFEDYKKLSEEYHTYGILWTPKEMSMLIDGKKYVTYDITKSFDDNPDMSMFNMPMDVLFTNYCMTNDTDMKSSMIWDSLDKMPICYYVDYVRLYQKPGEGKLWTAKSDVTTYRGRE